jgi:hypothetical protein
MHNLSVATASLVKFQRLTFANIQSSNERPGIQTSNESPITQPEYRQASSDTTHDAVAIRRKTFYREDSPIPLLQPSHSISAPVFPRLSPDIDSECCGGLLDCENLIEDPSSDNYVTDGDPGSKTTSRLSGLRSTSDYRLG